MPVFPDTPEFQNLKKAFVHAIERDSAAVANMLDLFETKGSSPQRNQALADGAREMEAAHNAKMDIYVKMLEMRLDKD